MHTADLSNVCLMFCLAGIEAQKKGLTALFYYFSAREFARRTARRSHCSPAVNDGGRALGALAVERFFIALYPAVGYVPEPHRRVQRIAQKSVAPFVVAAIVARC